MDKLIRVLGLRVIPVIALFLALFYLFEEYDRYVKGEDSWMSGFADWMIYLAETTRLFKEELIGTFNAIKEFRLGDALGTGVLQNASQKLLNFINPSFGIIEIAKELTGMPDLPAKQPAAIPYSNGFGYQPPVATPPYRGVLSGEINVKGLFDQFGRPVPSDKQKVPVRIDLGGTRP